MNQRRISEKKVEVLQAFRRAEPLTGVWDNQRYPLAQNDPASPNLLINIAPADMTVPEAIKLRDWLNKVLPP